MQQLPSSGAAREALRLKGQFWTPTWLARVMAAGVTARRPPVLFDPAVGPGRLSVARDVGFAGDFAGFELDGSARLRVAGWGLPASEPRRNCR